MMLEQSFFPFTSSTNLSSSSSSTGIFSQGQVPYGSLIIQLEVQAFVGCPDNGEELYSHSAKNHRPRIEPVAESLSCLQPPEDTPRVQTSYDVKKQRQLRGGKLPKRTSIHSFFSSDFFIFFFLYMVDGKFTIIMIILTLCVYTHICFPVSLVTRERAACCCEHRVTLHTLNKNVLGDAGGCRNSESPC